MALSGPSLPPTQGEKRKRGPEERDDSVPSRSPVVRTSPTSSAQEPRTIGPTLPPGFPTQSEDGDTSDEDDGFGPALPAGPAPVLPEDHDTTPVIATDAAVASSKTNSQRDEWMIVPPTSSDWSARMDPTKLKNRKFNTGKGAKGPARTSGHEDNTIWTENPEEKRARIQREVMGVKAGPIQRPEPEDNPKARENARKLREYSEKSRGPTLYQKHQKSDYKEKEDDPSARAFDREKDIAGGMKINSTQRREMMTKAADFGSKFSSGKFL